MISVARKALVWLLPLATLSAEVKLPDGEGKDLVENVCASCHDLDTAVDTKRTETEWKKVVDTMKSRGAEATDEEFATIVKYLTKNFGKAGGELRGHGEKRCQPKRQLRIQESVDQVRRQE